MDEILDTMAAEIRTEMQRHIARWGKATMSVTSASPSSMERWEQNLTNLKKMLREKVEITKQDLQDFFNLSDARMKELGLK